jgi:hypothetical protein
MNNETSELALIEKDPISSLFTAVRTTHTLYAAHEMKLFPIIHKRLMTLLEVAHAMNMQERAALALLSMCASLGLVKIDDGKYVLTEVSKHYLLPESPYYFGAFVDMAIGNPDVLSYDKFKKALLSNAAQVYDEKPLFEKNEEDVRRAESFTRAMHSKSMTAASIWPKIIDLSQYHTFLDVAGGSGAHAIEVVKIWSAIKAIVYDRPFVCKIAEEYVAGTDLQDRIKVQAGDMWTDPFPEAELHFYSDIFHDWPLDKCEFLAEKSYQSLPHNGRIIIHELLFNDDKSGPMSTAVYNIIMLLWTQGQQYSGKEMLMMLEKIGFREVAILPTGFGDWRIVTGVK